MSLSLPARLAHHRISRDRGLRPLRLGLLLCALAGSGLSRAQTGAVPTTVPPAIMALLQQRCSACHASHPSMMASAPRGLDFEQPSVVLAHDYDIYNQVAVMRAMPLGNISHMSESERAQIRHWYLSRARAREATAAP